MANKKYYYYVLVFTDEGPKYVTSVEYETKTASWDKTQKPKEFSMHEADNLVFGLICNMFSALTVKSPIELNTQPYRYDSYEIEWKNVEGGEE